jgi:hypothetical protein
MGRRPVGLAEPDGSEGANFDEKDFDLGAWNKFRVAPEAPLPLSFAGPVI